MNEWMDGRVFFLSLLLLGYHEMNALLVFYFFLIGGEGWLGSYKISIIKSLLLGFLLDTIPPTPRKIG